MKQQMTSIRDLIIVCLFQNYKNMWNKRTDAKGKRQSKVVSSKTCYRRTGPRSAVGKVSGYRCETDCRSRGREFDPSPVPYFRGD